MNYKKSINYDNLNSCYVLFNPQEVRMIKSFLLSGSAKSVRISKSSIIEVWTIQVFPGEFVKKFWGDQGISFELVKVRIIRIQIRESWLYRGSNYTGFSVRVC